MAKPTKEEMAWISSAMAARALTRAADPETRHQLVSALRSWLLDTDVITLRELAQGVAADFYTLANAIDDRRDRLVRKGKAKPYGVFAPREEIVTEPTEARSAAG